MEYSSATQLVLVRRGVFALQFGRRNFLADANHAVLFNRGDEYRVSMRSKGDIDIGSVAKEFGGGGHKNAAGCSVTGDIEPLRKLFIEKLERAIELPEGTT